MNTVIVLSLCALVVSAVQGLTQEEKDTYHKECMAQTGVEEQVVMNALGGVFAEDPNLKSYLLCFGKKMGIHSDAGDVNRDAMQAKLSSMFSDQAIIDEMMKCVVEKDTPEETAFQACKCMFAVKHEFVDV